MKSIGEQLRYFRELKGMKRQDLANLLFLTHQALYNYEKGKRQVPLPVLLRSGEILGFQPALQKEGEVILKATTTQELIQSKQTHTPEVDTRPEDMNLTSEELTTFSDEMELMTEENNTTSEELDLPTEPTEWTATNLPTFEGETLKTLLTEICAPEGWISVKDFGEFLQDELQSLAFLAPYEVEWIPFCSTGAYVYDGLNWRSNPSHILGNFAICPTNFNRSLLTISFKDQLVCYAEFDFKLNICFPGEQGEEIWLQDEVERLLELEKRKVFSMEEFNQHNVLSSSILWSGVDCLVPIILENDEERSQEVQMGHLNLLRFIEIDPSKH